VTEFQSGPGPGGARFDKIGERTQTPQYVPLMEHAPACIASEIGEPVDSPILQPAVSTFMLYEPVRFGGVARAYSASFGSRGNIHA
jgi:hypothetical protein